MLGGAHLLERVAGSVELGFQRLRDVPVSPEERAGLLVGFADLGAGLLEDVRLGGRGSGVCGFELPPLRAAVTDTLTNRRLRLVTSIPIAAAVLLGHATPVENERQFA